MRNIRQFKLCIILIGFIGISTIAQATEYEKHYYGSETLSANEQLQLLVKYSDDVYIETTNGSTTTFDVLIKIEAKNENAEEIETMFQEIDIQFEEGSVGLELNCFPFNSISKNSNWFFSGTKTEIKLKNGKTFKFSADSNIDIIVKIKTPQSTNLKLKAQFSDVGMDYLSGHADIDLKHSDLEATDLQSLNLDASFSDIRVGNIIGDAEFDLKHSDLEALDIENLKSYQKFSDIDVSKTGPVVIDLSHSDFTADRTGNIKCVDAEFSEIEVDKAKDILIVDGDHSKFKIGRTKSFIQESGSFSSVLIDNVFEKLILNVEHTDLKVEMLESSVREVEVKDSHSTVILGTEAIPSYELFLKVSRYTTLKTGDYVQKKSDGYYQKIGGMGEPIEMNIECPHCTVHIE